MAKKAPNKRKTVAVASKKHVAEKPAEKRKAPFWWPKKTEEQKATEFVTNGVQTLARVEKPFRCSLKSCKHPGGKIVVGDMYYQSDAWKRIAHQDCADSIHKESVAKALAQREGSRFGSEVHPSLHSVLDKGVLHPITAPPVEVTAASVRDLPPPAHVGERYDRPVSDIERRNIELEWWSKGVLAALESLGRPVSAVNLPTQLASK
jgi:hypothetical protein